jgi:hypothetical protein
VTVRRGATIATAGLALVLAAALTGCSSDAPDREGGRRPPPTTAAPSARERWVARWRGTVAEQYGPAQQSFLAAVRAGQVAGVQAAVTKLLAANQALLAAIAAAGPAPEAARTAANRLQLALTAEQQLLQQVQRTCTGRDNACAAVVDRYGDNNSKQVVPAFVALRI